jgi:predicted lipid carrier protein YhbT
LRQINCHDAAAATVVGEQHESGKPMAFASLFSRGIASIPRPIVRVVAARAFAVVLQRHPDLFDRLGEEASKRYAFVPLELPFAFVIEPGRHTLKVLRKRVRIRADATISGSIFLLLELLEGRSDGDAAFFSRDLSVVGDMEAVLALRNALDNGGVDLPRDIGASAGVFGPVVTRAAGMLRDHALARRARSKWN